MDLGIEDETTEFVDGMQQLDEALKAMASMLNRYNRADVYIGVGGDGTVFGQDLSDDDVARVIERMGEKVRCQPKAAVRLERDPQGRRYISIHAEGYETPYSYDGWFYVRRYRVIQPEGPGGPSVREWRANLTCAMKRHRSLMVCYSRTAVTASWIQTGLSSGWP